jgi:hypothetical protein
VDCEKMSSIKIESDQYKFEGCSITNDECCGYSCTTCSYAIREQKNNERDEAEYELKKYTIFEQKKLISGVYMMANNESTIAKLNLNDMILLQEKGIVSNRKSIYHPVQLEQWWMNLTKLRKYNKLGVPDNIWAKNTYPAVFQFGDLYYIIAPKYEPA